MWPTVRVRAEVELFPGEVSGKTRGYRTGARPNHFFEGQASSLFGLMEFDGGELHLGQRCLATVSFHYPNYFPPLTVGTVWRINEGPRHVGNGKVIEISHGN